MLIWVDSIQSAIAEHYNTLAEQNGWELYNITDYEYPSKYTNYITCNVVGIIGESYGKYPKASEGETIIMEYDNFLPYVAPYMKPAPPSDFLDWVNADPTILQ